MLAKQRFMRILDKKLKGIAVLCATVLFVGTAGTLVACRRADGPLKPGTIHSPGTIYSRNGELIISYDAGHSYSLDEKSNVIISYNDGETTVKAPLTLHPIGSDDGSGPGEDEAGFYISEEKTAIAYGGADSLVQVLISDDMGKTWNTYPVADSEARTGFNKFIGFTTKNDGWLVAADGVAMGHEENRIFLTSDGGKTWHEIGNSNDVYARVLTGAGFVNDQIGFLCFRYDSDFQPAICRTLDGGLTWQKLYLTLPKKYDEYGQTPLSPVFDEGNGLFPILLSKDGANNVVGTIYLTSDDYGKTWTYDRAYDDLKK